MTATAPRETIMQETQVVNKSSYKAAGKMEPNVFIRYRTYLLHCFCIPPIFVELPIAKTKQLSEYI